MYYTTITIAIYDIVQELSSIILLPMNPPTITMLIFLILVVCDTPAKARDKLWFLLQIGLGGYPPNKMADKCCW